MATIGRLLQVFAVYTYGLLNYCLYFFYALRQCRFRIIGQPPERERNQLLLARDQYWNLSKSISDFHHRFCVLRDGFKFHYLTNNGDKFRSHQSSSKLLILIHGFPDSSLLWRHITESQSLKENSTIVAVDLPGTGGSDSLPRYGANEVLEALTEFIVAMRELYHGGGENPTKTKNVFIVGHDWGCVLAYRLAAEAPPGLADRYVLTNAPYMPLAIANKDRIVESSKKMLLTFLHSPRYNFHCLPKIVHAMRPLLKQMVLSGYVFAFKLPEIMVRYLGLVGNSSLPRLIHKGQYGIDRAGYSPHHSMATSIGPGEAECQSATREEKPQSYSDSVLARAKYPGSWFVHFTAYYRDGVASGEWEKSLKTLAALYNIDADNGDSPILGSQLHRKRRLSSGSSTPFLDFVAHGLHAPATILWGQEDKALTEEICLQGIGDYLHRGSQVVLLPDTSHWTPLEKVSRRAFQRILEVLVQKGDIDEDDIQMVLEREYPTARVSVAK